MEKTRLIIKGNGELFSNQVHIADTPWTRFRGLMGRKSIPETYCLWIRPCNQVHMMHMRFSIDVIYLDGDNRVVAVHRHMKPWTVGKKVKGAKSVIECKAGFASAIEIDDQLVFKQVS